MSVNLKTVLLVEDDSNDVLLLQRAFRRAGLMHSLQVVTDGDQAVAYLSGEGQFADRTKHPLPSLILLDLKLPRRSGLEMFYRQCGNFSTAKKPRSGFEESPNSVLKTSRSSRLSHAFAEI